MYLFKIFYKDFYKHKLKLFLVIISLLYISGCSEDAPTVVDGENSIMITALWDSTGTGKLNTPMAEATVILISEYGRLTSITNSSGKVFLDGLPSGEYKISVRMIHPEKPGYVVVGTNLIIAKPTQSYDLTVKGDVVKNADLVINEVYFSGPQTDFFYFEDQYIELYNFSKTVQYLDGIIIMRSTSSNDGIIGGGEDADKDGDIDIVQYTYTFPGNPGGTKHPVNPGEFVVVALDAVDHRNFVSKSIDLSDADWEFRNQFDAQEFNNLNVPDLHNLRAELNYDFYLNLESGVILLCNGRDRNLEDGMDIETILDGFEYQVNIFTRKTIDEQIDKGFALSPLKYSGRSLQRIEPGFDSNDSSLDFEIISNPTPGW